MMAKQKKKMPRRRSQRNRGRPVANGVQAYGPVTAYAHLLKDPCNAPLSTPYPGEAGFVQRFVLDTTVNTTAGDTAGYFVFSPSANQTFILGRATSGTAGTPGIFPGPGATYLNANAGKMRPISACITVIPSAVSYNNLTGELGVFNTSSDTITTGTSLTVDQVLQLTGARTVLAKRSYDARWMPGSLDHTYNASSPIGGFTISDSSDANMVGIAYRGYPAGTALTIRVTLVCEWTPDPGLGITTTAARNPNVLAHDKVVAAMSHQDASWWHDLMRDAGQGLRYVAQDIGKAARYGIQRGLVGAVQYAERNVMPIASGLLMAAAAA
jgi:hypothetical protein